MIAAATWYFPDTSFGCAPYYNAHGAQVIGAASNDWPCGTKLTLTRGHRRYFIRIIDRCGPGCAWNGAALDLTARLQKRVPGLLSAGKVFFRVRTGWPAG